MGKHELNIQQVTRIDGYSAGVCCKLCSRRVPHNSTELLPLHIRTNGLSIMPAEQRVGRAAGVLEECWVQMGSGNAVIVVHKKNDFVRILKSNQYTKVAKRTLAKHTSGFIDQLLASKSV